MKNTTPRSKSTTPLGSTTTPAPTPHPQRTVPEAPRGAIVREPIFSGYDSSQALNKVVTKRLDKIASEMAQVRDAVQDLAKRLTVLSDAVERFYAHQIESGSSEVESGRKIQTNSITT